MQRSNSASRVFRWLPFALSLAALTLASSVGLSQGVVKPPCNWMDVGPEVLQRDNPGSVTAGPLLAPGPHTVWVAVKQNNPMAPYSLWTPTGPFNVSAGKKYLVRVEDGSPPVVSWQEEPAKLNAYRNPGSMGAVYFNNATQSGKWYAIAVCSGNVPGSTGLIAMSGFRFGITLSTGKLLTYAPNGVTNTTVASIDGKTIEFGHPNGRVVEPYNPLPGGGVRSTWIWNNVRFTQLLEPMASTSGVKDTVLVRWRIRNEDTKIHQVGLRAQIDTLIGNNDGVPFAVPGMAGLVTTMADFPKQGAVPHFIQALEVPDLKNPGTVALMTFQVGGKTEPPSRVSLTHWPGSILTWDIPMMNMGADSAVVMYWPEKALQLNEEREIGFSYGLGEVKSSDTGRLGSSTVAQAASGSEFPITVYVKDPTRGETVTLQSPSGVDVLGSATQTVPMPPPENKDRMSLVTWKAKAQQAGKYDFTIRSSSGEEYRQTVAVRQGEETTVADGKAPTVTDLIRELNDPDEASRLRAAKILGRLGGAARTALPALQNAMNDRDEDVRRVAANSVKIIQAAGPAEALTRLIGELRSTDEIARLKAAKELGRMGEAARDAVPELQRLLQDPDEDVRRVAAGALSAIQGTGRPVVPPLVEPPARVARIPGSVWSGTESLAGFGKLNFQFDADGKATMTDAKSKVTGRWTLNGEEITITFNNCVYRGTVKGQAITGSARYTEGDLSWTYSLTYDGPAPPAAPAATPRISASLAPGDPPRIR